MRSFRRIASHLHICCRQAAEVNLVGHHLVLNHTKTQTTARLFGFIRATAGRHSKRACPFYPKIKKPMLKVSIPFYHCFQFLLKSVDEASENTNTLRNEKTYTIPRPWLTVDIRHPVRYRVIESSKNAPFTGTNVMLKAAEWHQPLRMPRSLGLRGKHTAFNISTISGVVADRKVS